MKQQDVYLDHVIECIEWINRHVTEGRDVFLKDRKTQSAVLREFQTMAESTQRLSLEQKQQYPAVPWEAIAGFRNLLVHDYLGIKLERVWEIIQRDIPVLRTAVEAMKKEALR